MQGCWYLIALNRMDKQPSKSQQEFIEMLQTLTDAELAHHFPKLAAKLDRDGIIKAVVFGVEK
jgi:hypothetical protein